jgi:hypothetical protein
MSNSGQERNTKVHPTQFLRQLYLFRGQEKHIKLYRNVWPVNLLFQLQFRAENSNTINFFPLIALLCCFAVYKARLFYIKGLNPSVKSKHSCVSIRVRLNVCLHYFRQQFPFTLRIVSTKSPYIAASPLVVLVRCLLVAVTKFQDKFASLRQVNSSNSQDKFQICCTDMYLAEFLANFAVFHVFFVNFAGFRGYT